MDNTDTFRLFQFDYFDKEVSGIEKDELAGFAATFFGCRAIHDIIAIGFRWLSIST